MGNFLPSNLSQYFSAVPEAKEYRLVIAADGLDKRGKTHWAIMTTPDPVLVVTADTGTQEIIDQALRKGRKVAKMLLSYPSPDPKVRAASGIDAVMHAAWKSEWQRFMSAMYEVIKDQDGAIRTLVWDTGTDIKNLLELAHFGKLKGNARQDIRTDMNAEFHTLFWDLYKKRPDLNIIIIHRNKKQYIKGKGDIAEWNGNYERDGHKKLGFYVDLVLTFDWDPIRKDFYTSILPENPCRYMQHADTFMGQKFYRIPVASIIPGSVGAEKESHFAVLGETIFPETAGTGVWE